MIRVPGASSRGVAEATKQCLLNCNRNIKRELQRFSMRVGNAHRKVNHHGELQSLILEHPLS